MEFQKDVHSCYIHAFYSFSLLSMDMITTIQVVCEFWPRLISWNHQKNFYGSFFSILLSHEFSSSTTLSATICYKYSDFWKTQLLQIFTAKISYFWKQCMMKGRIWFTMSKTKPCLPEFNQILMILSMNTEFIGSSWGHN